MIQPRPSRVARQRWVVFAALLLLPSSSSAWNDVGHTLIAQMAFQELKPQTRTRVMDLLAAHPARPGWVLPPNAPPRVTESYLVGRAANWPDEIRAKNNPLHGESKPEAHYIDLPYSPDPSYPIPETHSAAAVSRKTNILTQLEWSESVLKDAALAPETRARALSWLLHLVGDIHQPLHCAALFSRVFPDGDRGGNELVVAPLPVTVYPPKEGTDIRFPNLHMLWDDLLGVDRSSEAVGQAQARCAAHARPEFAERLALGDFASWSKESHDLAVQVAYGHGTVAHIPLQAALSDIRSGKPVTVPTVPAAYLDTARATAERQAAVAAYRLADRLETLLGR